VARRIPVPPGTPRWGARWKEEAKKNYLRSFRFASQGSSYAAYANHLDLDPIYTDRFGRPLLRMTFDFPDNDIRMSNCVVDKMEPIANAMNPGHYVVNRRAKPYSVVPDQSTHNTGGAIRSRPRGHSPLPSHALSRLYEDDARGRACHSRIPADDRSRT
jgi:gluconate 2-dehydrogenase alpha chain